ncbi:hypothetical protein CERSUDRAFT_119912 [Gelatoporia subvermispora B]|uniref:Uncharacterized protein n=1 Tax=Ceriporiopsis subvermispora (strain B) TaxID=914234 RepID=M2QXT3_CERS8|nr:hypothetical protein CERSUDRAFT_119912 [Gelatoporia subvermispora B]
MQRLQGSSALLLGALTLIAHVSKTRAQTTNATCLDGFSWMFNERNQSPCQVSAYLIAPCLDDPSDAFVDSLPPGFHYVTPQGASVNPCDCNTVIYSTMQACAACQSRPVQPWSTWETNCTGPGIQEYPEQFSSGTSVPAWAYLDVVEEDSFDVNTAQQVASEGIPDATSGNLTGISSTGLPSSTTNPFSSNSGSQTTNPLFPQTSGSQTTGDLTPTNPADNGNPNSNSDNNGLSSSSKKSSNTGAIVGGVVGGVVGAALLGLGAFLLVRHNRTRSANRPARGGPMDLDAAPAAATAYGALHTPPEMHQPYSPGSPSAAVETTPMMREAYVPSEGITPSMPKIYDPDDPSTFPSAGPGMSYAANPTVYSGASANTGYHPGGSYGPSNYSGAPEL